MNDDIEYVLTQLKTWAVVGCSPQPWRDSHRIAAMLQGRGYRVIPVNPEAGDELLGERCFDALPADQGIEVVDLFRRSEAVSAHVDEAIAIGAKAVWMQLGIVNDEAAARAEAAGLKVVMDHCPKIEFARSRLRPVGGEPA